MVDLKNLGVSSIKTIKEEKTQQQILLKKQEFQKIVSNKRKNFINAVVCVEYGIEHFDVALNQDFKDTELQSIKRDFVELQNHYSRLRSKLEKFIKIESMEDEFYHIKDLFQSCLDEIQKGNVMFVDEKEITKLKKKGVQMLNDK